MKPAPLPDNDRERIKALHRYKILDTGVQQEFDDLAELGALICGVPVCLITFMDEKRQWFKSHRGTDNTENERSLSFCQYTVLQGKPLEVADAARDPRFKELDVVKKVPNIRFYAGYPLTDPDGYTLGTICVMDTEVKELSSHQHQALQLLANQLMVLLVDHKRRAQLRVFEQLFELSDDLICSFSHDGYLKDVNPAFEKVLGWDRTSLLKTSLIELIHPQDRKRASSILFWLESGRAAIKPVIRLRHNDGTDRYIQWGIKPEPESGNLLAIGRDITQQRSREMLIRISEDKFRSFFNNSQGLMCTHDLEGNFLTVNSVGAQILGYTVEEVLKMSLVDLTPPKHYPGLQSYLQQIRDTGKCSGLMTTTHKDGHFLVWNFRNILVNDVKGSQYIVGNCIDVTQSHKQQKELSQAKLLAEQASIAKSDFLANMSHEIRTPLNGIIGFTELILKTDMAPTQKQYVNIVNESANTLLAIINDILDFSKIEAGKLELDIEKCDLYEITADSTGIVSFLVQSKGLEMLLNLPASLPRFIWADYIRLKQVLINLLGNAAKFTDSGEIELSIEILNYKPNISNELTCRFVVRDTGIGIGADKKAKIFEAFLQEDSSTTKKYGGTGLGLAISNKLLAMMGSSLQLESTQGEGSTFYFDLTFKSEAGESLLWENTTSINKVLVVDDNANNRRILEKMLDLLGIASFQVSDGIQALEHLATGEAFDAILMDYHMPHIDGLETARQIRKSYSADVLPIVLLHSSADDTAVLKGCEALQVNYRLMRPIKLQELTFALSRLSFKEAELDLVAQNQNNPFITQPIDILIAEDNPINMFLAKTVIKRIATHALIREAINGEQAVKFCHDQLPDLIFMDIQMPIMNGYEATGLIRAMQGEKKPSIVALTAGNVKGEKERCLRAGMDDFISKPFAEKDLREVFAQFLGSNRPVDQSQKTQAAGVQNTPIDMDKIRSTYMNDHEFIIEFLGVISDSLQKGSAELKKHIQANDLNAIKAVGHKLKGTAASAFIPEATRISALLENLNDFDHKHISVLTEELDTDISSVLQFLKTYN